MKASKYSRILPILTILIAASSCGGTSVKNRLNDIESYIQERPDSALAAIREIDTNCIRTTADRAKYSLLNSMAIDKNYIDTTDISIIMPAVEYYRKHGTPEERLKSLYYLGQFFYNAQEYGKATLAYTEAYQFIDKSRDYKYCGMLCKSLANTSSETFNDADSFEYLDKAYYFASLNNDTLRIFDAQFAKAVVYANLQQWEKADSMYNLILDIKMPRYKEIDRAAKYAFYLSCVPERNDNCDKVIELYESLLETEGQLPSINDWCAYGYALEIAGRSKECEMIFQQLSKMEGYGLSLYWKSLADEQAGKYKQALTEYRSYSPYRDSILSNAFQQQFAKVQRDYYKAEEKNLEYAISMQRYTMLSITLGIIIILGAIIIILKRMREKAVSERNRFREIAELINSKLNENEKEYTKLYKDQFRNIGLLCEKYKEANESSEPGSQFMREITRLLNSIALDKRGQTRFEHSLNSKFNNVMAYFREEFQGLEEKDYRFVCYSFANFNATSIIALLDYPSQGAVYTKKDRIKKMIHKSTAPHKEMFLEYLS